MAETPHFWRKKKHCINLLVCLNFNSVAVCAICCKKFHHIIGMNPRHIIGMKSRQTDYKSYSCFCKNYNFLRNFKLKKSHHIIGIKSRQTNYKSNSCLCKNYNFLRTFKPKKNPAKNGEIFCFVFSIKKWRDSRPFGREKKHWEQFSKRDCLI